MKNFVLKCIDQPWEIEAIETALPESLVASSLTDSAQNTYICVEPNKQKMAGLISFADAEPFLSEKTDLHRPKSAKTCHITHFIISEDFQHTRVAHALLAKLVYHAHLQGYTLLLAAGKPSEIQRYTALGFAPVGKKEGVEYSIYAQINPHSIPPADPFELCEELLYFALPPKTRSCLKASEKPSIHQGEEFLEEFESLRNALCKRMNAENVQLLMGPAAMANDAVAGQLALRCQTGLILVNGEFGRRLIQSANGAKLFFYEIEATEGETFQVEQIEQMLKQHAEIGWIWAVHCETSTGVLNDLTMLKTISQAHEVELCIDCISSIGAVPIDLSNIYLASGTTGKGLASLSGLLMVFHDHALEAAPDDLPCALDLGRYQDSEGIPYALQSHLIYSLQTQMESDWEERFEEIRGWSRAIRRKLVEIDAPILAPDSCAMPALITIALSQAHCSKRIGDALKKKGIRIGYQSDYLRERNWIQVGMMKNAKQMSDEFIRLLKIELAATGR